MLSSVHYNFANAMITIFHQSQHGFSVVEQIMDLFKSCLDMNCVNVSFELIRIKAITLYARPYIIKLL